MSYEHLGDGAPQPETVDMERFETEALDIVPDAPPGERQKPAPKPAAAEEVGRLRKKEVEDAELERLKKALDKSAKDEDVEMKPVEDAAAAAAVGVEELDTGYYQLPGARGWLVGIISHKGRTADGGHYVGWTLHKKADGKDLKDDQWVLFDDDEVSFVSWKDMTGMSTDLCGGKADTQIAYINIYKKVTVAADPGQSLGAASSTEKEEDVKMEAGYS
ncbi:Ubiquitin carboxyl-terminal hydrolase 14 (Deubiquitinating enzyme 14) (Ubiquitin thioesterase 14) (Ubiquitin-specific-processing protease 14) [Durusdinium trenchii]|uniref:ubiquitinyl hydrolase 1 n=1 Tax=Durusdinium trenchii TaxID=1381693 RepID=A0ABP0R7I0_9DINO